MVACSRGCAIPQTFLWQSWLAALEVEGFWGGDERGQASANPALRRGGARDTVPTR